METQAQADAHRDASIAALNNLQIFLAGNGYFKAWNYAGLDRRRKAALTTRANYAANPALYSPTRTRVYDYRTAPRLQNFAVTADTQSEGYEFEFTANPLPTGASVLNASETTAVRTNVGGAVLDALVSYMDTAMAGVAGDLLRFNSDYVRLERTARRLDQLAWPIHAAEAAGRRGRSGAPQVALQPRITNYTFTDGALHGFAVGGGYRWQDKVVIGYPVIPGANGLASFDLSQPYYGPSEDAIDLWVSYEHKITNKINWKIQLNVRMSARTSLIPISVEPDGHTWAAVRIAPGQTFASRIRSRSKLHAFASPCPAPPLGRASFGGQLLVQNPAFGPNLPNAFFF